MTETFVIRARPLVRNLTIMDLPDEILSNIFGLIGGEREDGEHEDGEREEGMGDVSEDRSTDISSIKNVRLSCRRFCNTSSHLLLTHLDVHMSPSSLAHLDEVSRHPTISKGIRTLCVGVQFYGSAMADDLWLFASLCITKFGTRLESPSYLMQVSPQQLIRFLGLTEDLVQTWSDFVNTLQEPTDEKGRLGMAALRQGHEKYRQLQREQEDLFKGGGFIRAISAAAARMPTMVRLLIKDSYYRPYYMDGQEAAWENRLNSPGLWIEEEMALPTIWQAEMTGVGHPPTSLLYELPIAIHRAGTPLLHMEIRITPPSDFLLGLDEEQSSELKSAVENIRTFMFTGLYDFHPDGMAARDPRDMAELMDYLAIFVGSQKAETLSLDFAFLDMGCDDVDRSTIASALPRLRWSSLRDISLSNISMHLHELLGFLNKLEPKTSLRLKYTELMSGTWAEALDAIRVKSGLFVVFDGVWGGECNDLPWEEWEAIFRGTPPNYDMSLAAQYVRGIRADNPLRPHDDTTQ